MWKWRMCTRHFNSLVTAVAILTTNMIQVLSQSSNRSLSRILLAPTSLLLDSFRESITILSPVFAFQTSHCTSPQIPPIPGLAQMFRDTPSQSVLVHAPISPQTRPSSASPSQTISMQTHDKIVLCDYTSIHFSPHVKLQSSGLIEVQFLIPNKINPAKLRSSFPLSSIKPKLPRPCTSCFSFRMKQELQELVVVVCSILVQLHFFIQSVRNFVRSG